ncbi:hypothetical protein HG536_0D04320 [Torulaspora globosa]|uniref:Zn(2)-C6 fungal-type domain-containing protein n=1 Tax=Torulaspora globosa TaxID=48254 RepID=A0A7G3ZHC4_9SACH|nr:uncharacterized protein HG536_0D04320 [Torulaspora globosa]QLL32910.1 hypothetical protein HG536_0D04320 [Torulaspora globosa]
MSGQKITRRRLIKSCKYCYDHKLRCDKGHPCSTCVALKKTEQCIYGFSKDLLSVSSPKVASQGIKRTARNSVVYKPKYFYPFFASTINEKILSTDRYDKTALSSAFTRNEIHKFNRSISPLRDIKEMLALLPESEAAGLSHADTYFERVHPILPIISRERVLNAFTEVYESLRSQAVINAGSTLIVMAVFFCSSYSAVASGIIPDLLLCNNYYKAFRHLLDIVEFPFIPQLESLQAFTVVNFVIDPNMVDAAAYSSMLVRMGQELGLHKDPNTTSIECKLTWNLLLYIEGSSSVVRGFPFSTSSALIEAVPLPDTNGDVNYDFPVSYTVGRCKINKILRKVMELTSVTEIPREELNSRESEIASLYDDVQDINLSLKRNFPVHQAYFASTLLVFLYRLHLRFFALSSLQFQEDKLVQKTSNQLTSFESIDVTSVLGIRQTFKEEVVQLSLLLLFQTHKRLVQADIEKYAWYTRGSTVMQYLFVIISDLFHSPCKTLETENFLTPSRQTIDDDMRDVINSSPSFFRYALVEGVLTLIESKLAALWSNEDLYKFLLIQNLKEKVWQINEDLLKKNEEEIKAVKNSKFFAAGSVHMQNMKSINLEDCMQGWESEDFPISIDKVLNSWLIDLQN